MCTGIESLLFGTAAVQGGAAATAGLFGAGGAFGLAPTLTTLGTAASVAGTLSQGSAQQKAANEQAQQVLNEGAYRADAAKQQAEKIRKAGAAQKGEARASLAASGVKLGDGTPLEVDREITENSEEDALSALISGKRATSAAQEESKMLTKAGRNAMTSSVLEAGGTLAKGWRVMAQKG